MCGIVAYSGKDPVNKSIFKMLMLQSRKRGTQATGIGFLKKQEEKIYFTHVKELIDSLDFCSNTEIPETNLLLGHTRAPSSGGKEKKHAHPFIFTTLMGVHNGTLYNWKDINKEYGFENETDTYTLYALLNEKKTNIKKALVDMRGSMALAYITCTNKDEQVLNLYRHNNPIFQGVDDNNNSYFASSKDYLVVAGLKDITPLNEHEHYKFVEGEIKSVEDVGAPQKKWVSTGGSTSKHNNYSRSRPGSHYNRRTPTVNDGDSDLRMSDTLVPSASVPNNHIPFFQDHKIHYAWMVGKGEPNNEAIYIESHWAYGVRETKRFYTNNKDNMKALKENYVAVYKQLISDGTK